MKNLKYYEKNAIPLPIRFTTQGKALVVGSHGILWRARIILLSLGANEMPTLRFKSRLKRASSKSCKV